MGPSCAGKSSVSKEVYSRIKNENKNCQLIELDSIEDTLKEKGHPHAPDDLIQELINQASTQLLHCNHIVIDTNIYSEKFNYSFGDAVVKKIIISCPLNILLERNAAREEVIKRTTQQSYYAAEWIKETHASFTAIREQCNNIFDSSTSSIAAISSHIINEFNQEKQ